MANKVPLPSTWAHIPSVCLLVSLVRAERSAVNKRMMEIRMARLAMMARGKKKHWKKM